MKKLLMMLVVVGMFISGCNLPQAMEKAKFNKQNAAKLKMQDQRQQYFDEHLNLSPEMKQYVTKRDELYFLQKKTVFSI